MHRLSITIDLGKIKKERVQVRKWTDKDGVEHTIREYKLDVVPLKEEKIVKSGDTYDLIKTHFVAETTTKAECDGGYKGAILGDGLYFRGKEIATQGVEADAQTDFGQA
jgi:hypothetical protein